MNTYKAQLTRQEIEEKLLQQNSKQEFTYQELVNLSRNKKLIPGQTYILTDYEPVINDYTFKNNIHFEIVNNKQYTIYLKAITYQHFDKNAIAIDQNGNLFEINYYLEPNNIICDCVSENEDEYYLEAGTKMNEYSMESGWYPLNHFKNYVKQESFNIGDILTDYYDTVYGTIKDYRYKLNSKGFISRIIDKA